MSGPELLLQTKALERVNRCLLHSQSHWDLRTTMPNGPNQLFRHDSESRFITTSDIHRWGVETSTWLILYLCTAEECPFEAKMSCSSNKTAYTVCGSRSNTPTRGHGCVTEMWMLWEDVSTMRGHDYCKETWLWAGRHRGYKDWRHETHNELGKYSKVTDGAYAATRDMTDVGWCMVDIWETKHTPGNILSWDMARVFTPRQRDYHDSCRVMLVDSQWPRYCQWTTEIRPAMWQREG